MRSIFWRIVLLAGFTVLALVLFLPSTPFSKRLPSFWADRIPKIILGLDLQGGMHLVLSVDQDKAVENHTQRLLSSIEDALKKKNIPYNSVDRQGSSGVVITYPDEKTKAAIAQLLSDEFGVFGPPEQKDDKLVFTLDEAEVKRLKEWAGSQALETIRNRIDKFGVAEPVIQKQGENELVIQLPGLKDPERAIQLIGKTAVLEFRLLDESMDVQKALAYGPPPGSDILYQQTKNPQAGTVERTPYLVKKEILLTGDSLSDARVAIDTQYNEPYVSLTFDSGGGRTFERITSQNVGKRLAIVLDGNVHSAPQIKEAISGGKAQITGGFTHEEAADLAIVLRAGALPAPVTVIQNVTVGPTLGSDSIRAGVRAAILGAVLVLVFMAIYYKFSGLVADFAIFLNIVMLLGAMAWLNSTLTLPGIAGIILTIGMGVDANVLIFERIKEELRSGRTPRSAINAGYDHAWWTIIDSHVTTLITAAVLFQFGSGPIKGFAVSLSLGILINLFTSLVGTKVAFDVQNEKFRIKRLSI
ncbi:MAG: protein translocase subunit SecD [Deltaproteobacteria bacterium]|nr:protein translocase subunit SecD [Deltaproteobacteria bacterium]